MTLGTEQDPTAEDGTPEALARRAIDGGWFAGLLLALSLLQFAAWQAS